MKFLNILIVDDSPTIRKALSHKIKEFGGTAVTAEDGLRGLEMALRADFDLIITDVDMPRLSGIELCRLLKEHPATKSTPVIILSSRDSEKDIAKGFEVGASSYISKTNAPAELIDRIRQVLDKAAFVKKKHILVAAKSEAIRQSVVDGLNREGFQTDEAGDGVEAMRIIRKSPPDLIITDLKMPRIGGDELSRLVIGDAGLSHIPVVVMGAESEQPTMKRMLLDGVASYLIKPFSPELVAVTIERLLSDQFKLLREEKERLVAEKKLILASISSLVNALEARDPYTRGHSDAVADISKGIGQVMGLSYSELERLFTAAQLHDIGKIGVRDDVLLKKGRLEESEYEHIKTHTTIANDILAPIPVMHEIFDAAASHHERWDGKGYPKGLSGMEIPLWARIIAVADTYDALTSDRPYRKGMPQDQAVEIIKKERGSQHCPACVDAFLEYIAECGGTVRAEHFANADCA